MTTVKRNSRLEAAIDSFKPATTKLTRRQFLTKAALGVGLVNAVKVKADPTSLAPDVAATLLSESADLTALKEGCYAETISTRLFASSNAGFVPRRHRLSLARLRCAGFDVQNPQIVNRFFLRFAGTDIQRASDLQNIATGAVAAPQLLLGLRGGYGAMRLLPLIDWPSLGRVMKDRGTILAGFSDVTAIQCALLAKGAMSSLQAPMAYSDFGRPKLNAVTIKAFKQALTDPSLTITVASDQAKLANPAAKSISGMLWGGNLSVISALTGSPYLPKPRGGIVFLEEVGEPIYRIERMLYNLYLAGVFKHQQAIVFGAVTGSQQDGYDRRFDFAEVLSQLHRVTGLPICTGVPFGHIAKKRSIPIGAMCSLTTDDGGFTLAFSDYPVIQHLSSSVAASIS